jgi:OOP family OmpA-OmpF porin
MNRKTLCTVIALTLGGVASAQAQTFDDRWYVAPYVGTYKSDDDRLADNNSILLGIGVGRYLSPNTSIDIFIDRVHRDASALGARVLGKDDTMRSWMVGTSLRFYFGDTSGFAPYVMAGLGAIRHDLGIKSGWDAGLQAGVGLQNSFTDNVKLRAELAYRYDFDGDSLGGTRPLRDPARGASSPDYRAEKFGDWFFSLGVTMAIGEPPAPPPPPAPAPVAPPPAPVEPPPAPPEEIVIDLQGVMFEFDRPRPGQERDINRAGLLPGSIEILDQAVEVLNRYPNIRVEVAGHTDSIGSEEYNQRLSERRARVVYDYLVSRGISADRLVGPVGYGELRPIDTNDTREGRQRNRRTELVRQ